MSVTPGSLVRYREREWVVLPSEEEDIIILRPIGGSARETTGVLKPLADRMAASLPFERIEPATFPLPDPESAQDHAAVRLLQQSARLLLRDGAAPFRSLGHLSVRPRPYQFVPLLMALRLDTVRLLIADDVGVGKTIEGALIAREMLDRGEIQRLVVLCPPYLCDQWHKELTEKFNIDAVVVRSGTVSRLERTIPPDRTIFQHYPFIVASIDLVKQPHYKTQFLLHCPNFVIVDEAHGATRPPSVGRRRAQQQRYELLRALSEKKERHLLLLTATPHSGIGGSFLSLLGLLNPEYENLDLAFMEEEQVTGLARHFVQRRRANIERWMGEDTPFPARESIEEPYLFSDEYMKYYQAVYNFASDLVRTAEEMKGWKKRMRFWSALALLRCVTSSPAAAEATLEKRLGVRKEEGKAALEVIESASEEELDDTFEPLIYDPLDIEASVDAQPSNVLEAQEMDPEWKDAERRRLREFARQAKDLKGTADTKLSKLAEVIEGLLKEKYQPIVWCRFIATSDYVAEGLEERLGKKFKNLKVTSITGVLSSDERRLKVDELAQFDTRVLVATDCLSEGINLQEHFNAVVHYDLPWNPNRLEQREGRVDRYGQTSKKVKAVLIYGKNNPVDAAVLDVLLRKAREIHRDLKVHVPIPIDSETVMQTILHSLFMRARYEGDQLRLFDESPEAEKLTKGVHERWVSAAGREKESQARFAQRGIKPEEVEIELDSTDAVLGQPDDVKRFLEEASGRIGFSFKKMKGDTWELGISGLPPTVRSRLNGAPDKWRITFISPTPEKVTYIGRNHPLIESLSEHLMDLAFHPVNGDSPASRCGVIRTDAVSKRTTLFLLRLRYLIYESGDDTPALAEETTCWGFKGLPKNLEQMSLDESQELLDSARAVANVPSIEKAEVLSETLSWWDGLQGDIGKLLEDRAAALGESHKRLRRMLKEKRVKIEPQKPPDLLGIVVLLPAPGGAKS